MKERPAEIMAIPRIVFITLCFLIGFSVLGCGPHVRYEKGVVKTAKTEYRAANPGPGWKPIDTRGADLAFFNEKLDAFVMFNSTCDEYRDAPTRALANHLFIGIEKKKILIQEDRPLDTRDAVYTEVQGKLDGATVRVAAYTLVKNYCTYDISYSAPGKNFEIGKPALQELARRFKILKRKK